MEILTQDGFKEFDGFINQGSVDSLIFFEFSNGESLECTNDHLLLTRNNNYVKAQDLKVNDVLYNNIEIIKKKNIDKNCEVYDALNVKDTHSYWTNSVISHNCLLLDEFSFINDGIAREFYQSVYPAIAASTKSKIIIISTPNGVFNLYHEIFTAAKKGENKYKYIEVPWYRVPGRDQEWKEEQLANMSYQSFLQEFEVQFLGSSNTVIKAEILEDMLNGFSEPELVDLGERLRVYEQPKPGSSYIIGADPSKGTGQHDAGIQVARIDSVNPLRAVQVATFQSNTTDTYEFSSIINRLSIYYNNAWIFIENNGEGSTVSQNLWWVFENPNLYNSGQRENEIGIRATKNTKPQAVITMKKVIEDGSLTIKDRETAKQLSNFIEKKGKFFAKNTGDDLVSALYWLCYGFQTEVYEDEIDLLNGTNKDEDEDEPWSILTDIDDYHFVDDDFDWV